VFVAVLLAFFITCAPASADTFWQKTTWTTSDGVQLVGLYHPARRPEAYTWVFLHGLGSVKEEWVPFARKLTPSGVGVFLYDARGHNESTHRTNGQTISYKDWTSAGPGSPWTAMPEDLASAVKLLHRQYGVPEKRVAVGGASVGANVALVYASEHPEISALILLSAGVEYAGLNIEKSWHQLRSRPVFAAASPQDAYAYATMRYLAQQRPDIPLRVAEGPGGEHGVNMFKDQVLTKKLLDWIGQLK
jgi:pimeloyl-ACP methyl ester carboxylesterase